MTLLAPPQTASVGLRWTDNYMMDMAVAGLLVFSGKANLPDVEVEDLPQYITTEDLQKFQTWAERLYFAPDLKAWIYVVFTLNGFMNSSWTSEQQNEALRSVLTSYQRPNLLGIPCAFFPELPAQQRVARDLLPMLMGRGPMNFYPDGQPGLPISGLAITALQGLSVAAPLVSGRALLVDADDRKLLLQIVGRWQGELRKRAGLSLDMGARLDIWASARTRLVEAVREIMAERLAVSRSSGTHGGATIYHLSNSGQGPDIQIYSLQQPVIDFLEDAGRLFKTEWTTLTYSALHPADKGKDEQYGTRNDLDEALFSLPDEAPSFLRRFLMPPFRQTVSPPEPKQPKKSKKTDDGKIREMVPLKLARVWELTVLFLREVVGMDKNRIKAIRDLGDRLGGWIVTENDKSLFRSLYEVRGAGPMRHLLLKAALEKARRDAENGLPKPEQQLIITDELYLQVFMEQDEIARADFTLARDLLKMRVIQVLHEADFFNKNKGDPDLKATELLTEGER